MKNRGETWMGVLVLSFFLLANCTIMMDKKGKKDRAGSNELTEGMQPGEDLQDSSLEDSNKINEVIPLGMPIGIDSLEKLKREAEKPDTLREEE